MATITTAFSGLPQLYPNDFKQMECVIFEETGTSVAFQEVISASAGSYIVVPCLTVAVGGAQTNFEIGSNGNQLFYGCVPQADSRHYNLFPNAIYGNLSQNLQVKKTNSSADIHVTLWYYFLAPKA